MIPPADGAYYADPESLKFVEITHAEESELFRRFYDEDDLAARDQIIRNHLLLVAKIAYSVARGAIPNDEAVGVGNETLLEVLAKKRFKPSPKVRFSGYIRKFVWGAVRNACERRAPVRTPRNRAVIVVPMDAEIEDSCEAPENSDDQGSMMRALRLAMDRKWITPVERHVISRHTYHGETYTQIGRELPKHLKRPKVSRQRTQQIYQKALVKLRTLMRQYGVDR